MAGNKQTKGMQPRKGRKLVAKPRQFWFGLCVEFVDGPKQSQAKFLQSKFPNRDEAQSMRVICMYYACRVIYTSQNI